MDGIHHGTDEWIDGWIDRWIFGQCGVSVGMCHTVMHVTLIGRIAQGQFWSTTVLDVSRGTISLGEISATC